MSGNNFTGVVEVARKNDAGYWSIKTSDGKWFGCGKVKPTCDQGDEIAFDFSQNGNFNNVDMDTLEIISSGNDVQKASKPAWGGKKSATGEGASKNEYWEKKAAVDVKTQNEIRFQAARNAAIAFLDVALRSNLIEIPEGKDKNAKLKVALTYVDKITDQFVKTTKAVNQETVAEAVEKPKAAPKAKVVEAAVDEELNDELTF